MASGVKKPIKKDPFLTDIPNHGEHEAMLHRIDSSFEMDRETYEVSFPYKEASHIGEIHTIGELVKFAEQKDSRIEIQARVLGVTKDGIKSRKMDTQKFCETYKKNKIDKKVLKSLRESDSFDSDGGSASLVGNDFVPLLGGPFNKQLYYYDYLRQHALAFHAINHDPIGRRIVNLMVQFTLGRGFRVDMDSKPHLAAWRAMEEANDLPKLMRYLAKELSAYGEIMLWELPGMATHIVQNPMPGEVTPRGMIPRYRLIDPSVIWEIVTHPEDIDRELYYQWVAPTQYQLYTDGTQPTSKFIYQQIPADQIIHEKVNVVSNEKRGRSDLFPAFGYMKRLRDSVNWEMIKSQKNAAWGIDTTIEGGPGDMAAYRDDQQRLGTIAPAGSEFIHTKKVSRQYLGNSGSGGGVSAAFEWCMSMIAIATGFPISYLGSHLSGGSTKASALVATEPVAKMLEERQLVYEGIIKKLAKRCFKAMGLPENEEIEITFPEIQAPDRSNKIKDLLLAQQAGWISQQRCAQIAAKEFGITEFDFDLEQGDIQDEKASQASLAGAFGGGDGPAVQAPLSTGPQMNAGSTPRRDMNVTGAQRAQARRSGG